MSDDKKRTKDALLSELESIKGLLEDELEGDEPPLLTSHVDGIDEDPPLLTEALNDVIDDIRSARHIMDEVGMDEEDGTDDEDSIPILDHHAYDEDDAEIASDEDDDFDLSSLDDIPTLDAPPPAARTAPAPKLATLADDESDDDNDDDDIVARALRSNTLGASRPPPVAPEPERKPEPKNEDVEEIDFDTATDALMRELTEPDQEAGDIADDHSEEDDIESTAAAAPARKPPEKKPAEQAQTKAKEPTPTEHQPSLFDSPKPAPKPTKPAVAERHTTFKAAPAVATSLGKSENPFLPKHIRDRLHTNRTLQQEIDDTQTAHRISNEQAASPLNSDDKLVDQVLKTVLPKIETELRLKIRELIREERSEK